METRSRMQASEVRQPGNTSHNSRTQNGLTFYSSQVTERQSRSKSRNRNWGTERSVERPQTRSHRSRSKSRDIIALYTADPPNRSASCASVRDLPDSSYETNPTDRYPRSRSSAPARSLFSYQFTPDVGVQTRPLSCTSARSLPSFQFYESAAESLSTLTREHSSRSRSVAGRQSRTSWQSIDVRSRAKSESRCSSMTRDAISLCSNLTTQSRALSNSEIASQNLDYWMATSAKNQRKVTKLKKKPKKSNEFVTLLEMDPATNKKIEQFLEQSNSLRPANIPMMMIAGHKPSKDWSSADEIDIEHGAIVDGLYKQSEWLFVATKDGKEGFVPFAFTKPIKRSPNQENSPTEKQNVAGILKHTSHSLIAREHNSSDLRPESSSSNSSVFFHDINFATPASYSYPLPRQGYMQSKHTEHCIVVDTDYKYDGMQRDEMRTYCSDSGISEPYSNHSDENDSRRSIHTDGHTAGFFSRSALLSQNMEAPTMSNTNLKPPHKAFSQLPLGPLGERLQNANLPRSSTPQHKTFIAEFGPVHLKMSNDTVSRAQATTTQSSSNEKLDIPKDYNGPRQRVMYNYEALYDDDITVHPNEIVTILNGDDIEWLWVLRRDGAEGFIPREYVTSVDASRQKTQANHTQLVVAL